MGMCFNMYFNNTSTPYFVTRIPCMPQMASDKCISFSPGKHSISKVYCIILEPVLFTRPHPTWPLPASASELKFPDYCTIDAGRAWKYFIHPFPVADGCDEAKHYIYTHYFITVPCTRPSTISPAPTHITHAQAAPAPATASAATSNLLCGKRTATQPWPDA